MIVLDASAAVEFLLDRGETSVWVGSYLESIDRAHAPHLVDVEVAAAVRRLARSGEIPASRGAEALADLRELTLVRYPLVELLERIWTLRHVLTPYDAAYVALAESLGLPLLTVDARLARVRGHSAEILSFA